jgi:hypothetical protein
MHCYSTGSVQGGDDIGGFTGQLVIGKTGQATVSDNYWDKEASGLSKSDAADGLKTSEMQGSNAKDNMKGFDFKNIWQTNGDGYPTLQNSPSK